MVFYGLMAGISFGVFEGVQYQMTVNAEQTYDVSFFLNIARLTSLPFLHACWCGIAGYFLSFAHLYPKYRRGLYVLAISIPAIVHGLYDSFADLGAISLVMVFLGLMLLMMYLKQSVDYQSKLRQWRMAYNLASKCESLRVYSECNVRESLSCWKKSNTFAPENKNNNN